MKKQNLRIVVKIGSSSLTSEKHGCEPDKMRTLVAAIARLCKEGHEVLLVSSGAVSSGYAKLGYKSRPRTLIAKQAAAAVGQSILMQRYTEMFAEQDMGVAQILLTRSDFTDHERYQHAFQTISLLLVRGVLPIINENDTVSAAELTFGDNDMLGALVAGLLHAHLYIMLTDTNGLYDSDPRKDANACHIPFVQKVTSDYIDLAGNAGSLGTGGMRSKLLAAQTAGNVGIASYIGRLTNEDCLLHIVKGLGDGTYIGASNPGHSLDKTLSNRKQWIAFHSPVRGKINVDEGAALAVLRQKRSLLPAGICRVEGSFEAGDVVEVYQDHLLIGRGVSRFTSNELETFLKMNKNHSLPGEVIHRDYWTEFTHPTLSKREVERNQVSQKER